MSSAFSPVTSNSCAVSGSNQRPCTIHRLPVSQWSRLSYASTYVAAIGYFHKLHDLQNPTEKSIIKQMLDGFSRKVGKGRDPAQAAYHIGHFEESNTGTSTYM